jgi:hypothetical protein
MTFSFFSSLELALLTVLLLLPPSSPIYNEGPFFLDQYSSVTVIPFFQFGKQLQAEVIPGWSQYYLDYKFLKKIVSSLAAKRPASEAAALALGIRPGHSASPIPISGAHTAVDIVSQINEPSLIPTGQDDERGPDFQAHKAAFFFKLERELEKVAPVRFLPVPALSTDRRPLV